MEELFSVIGVFTLPLSIGLGVAWWNARHEVRWLRAERHGPLPLTSERTGDHFHRLEHAVDAIALEVERIAEGQRFTTKLLADRGSHDRVRTRSEPEHITPH